MPNKIPNRCARPGCPNLQPCAEHTRKPWSVASPRNRALTTRSGWESQRRRRRILERDGHRCYVDGCTTPATEVDHVLAIAHGGTDTDDNLAAICAPHHEAKSARERRR